MSSAPAKGAARLPDGSSERFFQRLRTYPSPQGNSGRSASLGMPPSRAGTTNCSQTRMGIGFCTRPPPSRPNHRKIQFPTSKQLIRVSFRTERWMTGSEEKRAGAGSPTFDGEEGPPAARPASRRRGAVSGSLTSQVLGGLAVGTEGRRTPNADEEIGSHAKLIA